MCFYKRFLVCLSFNGAKYCGWQVQKNGLSVHQVVQKAIERVLNDKFEIVACSRTDSGVHANKFFFHFDLNVNIEPDRFCVALNGRLPSDVAVNFVKNVDKKFHARYSAKKKEYVYKIWNSKVKNPFFQNLAWHYNRPIDFKKIKLSAKFLIGKHNFESFCCARSQVKDKERTLYEITITKRKELVIFKIVGDGFLHNMVRIIIGTLISVSEGLIEVDDVKKILQQRNRKLAGRTVPAYGLYLNNVFY